MQGGSAKTRISSEYIYIDPDTEEECIWRYCVGHSQLEKNKQPDFAKRTAIWVDKTASLAIRSNEKSLLKFMKNHPELDTNCERYGVRPKFTEFDPDKKARETAKAMEVLNQARVSVFDIDYTTQTLPILKLVYGQVDPTDVDTNKLRLLHYAESNPESFLELVEDVRIERAHLVSEAEALGIITYKAGGFHWGRGGLILSVPMTESNHYEYFVNWTYSNEGKNDWDIIVRDVRNYSADKNAAETYNTQSDVKESVVNELDADGIFEILLQKKAIKKDGTSYIYRELKGKKNIISWIDENIEEIRGELKK